MYPAGKCTKILEYVKTSSFSKIMQQTSLKYRHRRQKYCVLLLIVNILKE